MSVRVRQRRQPGQPLCDRPATGDVTFTGAGQDFEIDNFLTDLGGGNKGFRLKIVATEAGGTATVQTSQELVLDIKLNDVNEAPTAVTFGAASQLVLGEASAQTGAAVVTATFADPDGAASGNRNNRYKFANGTQVDGHFTIDATTGAITRTPPSPQRKMTARCSGSSPSTSVNPPWRLRRLTSLSICCSVPPTSSSRPSAAPPSILLKTSWRATSSELSSRPTMDLPASSSGRWPTTMSS